VQCEGGCQRWYHYVCAMYPDPTPLPVGYDLEDQSFVCSHCRQNGASIEKSKLLIALQNRRAAHLPRDPLSDAVEQHLAVIVRQKGIKLEGVTVRVVSSRTFHFPALPLMKERYKDYPEHFPYESRVLFAFQEIEGRDVAVFAMYVQEYGPECPQPNTNRTYISYLDSVRMLKTEPPEQRKPVHHGLINGYLRNARDRGFENAHIWVAPPQPGDEYIFHCRPPDKVHGKRTMSMSKLHSWYAQMLDEAREEGIVGDWKEVSDHVSHLTSIREFPLFDGDFFPDHLKTMLEAPPPPRAAGPPMLCRESSAILATSLKNKTRSMRKRFLVAPLKQGAASAPMPPPPPPGAPPQLSNALVDKRMDFLKLSTDRHWQFNEVRRAHYSTMMVLAQLGNEPHAESP